MATLKTTTLEGSLTGVVNGRPSIYISRNVRRNNTDNSSGDAWFKFATLPVTNSSNGPLLYLTFSGGPTANNVKTVQKIIVGTRDGFSASIVDEVLNGSSSSSYTNSSIQIYQETDGSYSLYIKLLGNTYSGGQVIVQDGSWSSWTPGNFPQYFDIIDGSPSHTSTPSGTLVFDGSSASERGLIIKDYVNDNVGIGGISAPLNTLHIHGSNAGGAANLGPKLGFTTTNDAYHLFQIFPYAHDNISLLFDSYYNSGWFSSDAGSNFAIYKYGDLLRLRYDSGIAQGSAITWNDGLVMDVNGNIGIGTTNPVSKLQIGNGTSNSYSTVAQLSGDSGGASILSALSLVNSRGAALSNGVSIDFHTANNYSSTGKIATVQAGATTTDSELRFYTYNSGLNQRMVLNYLGNVGIGTASPAYKLEVVGDMRVSGGIVDAGSSAQWTLSGGGTVTWNGSYILWGTRVIAIPVEKTEFSILGFLDITCPTSGTITYYNSSNVTTTVTCTANGIPIGIWEALYYEITPGQSQTSDQTKFRLVNYQNSTWRPSSNWILICTRNGDSGTGDAHLKWIPGQINIPYAGGIYYSGTGLNNWESNGTTNYISKFTSANVLGNSTIYDNGTNVGIGTASPTSLVHLYKASGDSILTIDNTGDGNTSGIDFNRQRLSGPGLNGASIFLDSDTSTNNAFLYIQAQSTSAQAGVTSALGANNGVRLLLRGNTGQFSIENGASESFRIDASGNVGIGATSPIGKLNVIASTTISGANLANSHILIGTATAGLGIDTNEIYNKGGTALVIGTLDASPVQFRPNSSDAVIITATGNVGIGTSSPTQKLDVAFNTDTSAVIGRAHIGYVGHPNYASFSHINQDSTTSYALLQGSVGNTLLNAAAGYPINFRIANVDKMILSSAGDFGIGTTNPLTKLHVVGSQMSITNGQGQDEGIFLIPENSLDGNGGGRIFFKENSSDDFGFSLGYNGTSDNAILNWPSNTFCISRHSSGVTGVIEICIPRNTGNVGVGTTSPSGKLHIQNDVNSGTLAILRNANTGTSQYSEFQIGEGTREIRIGSAYNYSSAEWNQSWIYAVARNLALKTQAGYSIRFYTGGTTDTYERARIDTSGNVGIGTTSPAYKLQVNGSFAATTKSFDIPHPTKENKRLVYASLEGPENGVYIRGKNDTNIIELPEYWTKLVDKDTITVVLTAIGKTSDNKIRNYSVDKIEQNKVYVYTDNPDNIYNYFYVVYGERMDVPKLTIERNV